MSSMTVKAHLKSDATTMTVHRSTDRRFSDDHAIDALARCGDAGCKVPGTRQPTDLF
jgi:hypothetical protein